MHGSILLPLLGVAIYVAYRIVHSIILRIQHASIARQLGAKDAPRFPSGFMGIPAVKEAIAADKAGQFTDLMISRQQRISAQEGRVVSTFNGNILGSKMYFTSDPKNIQHILAHKFEDFDLGPTRNAIMGKVLGDGIFTQDGKKWEHSRAMLRPNFVRDQISDLDMEEIHIQNMMKQLPTQSDGWTPYTDIQTLFFRLTLDAATEFLFGESVLTQIKEAGAPPAPESFSANFDQAQKTMADKFRFGDMHWLYNPKSYKVNADIVNDFVKHYVDKALQASEKGPTSSDKYVFLEALSQKTRDPVQIRAQLLNILLAGRDTTASLLSWTFHQLLRNPEVFDKLRQTVIETFGTYEDPQDISFATLKGCQYLQCTLNETLRLWTVVPGNGRRANKNTTLPRGGGPDGLDPVFIPANTQVDYSIHVMHRRKDIWGEDANEYKPERFIGRKPGWEYLPFNGGPRICIGQQFALTEASYVMVRLLQRFDKIEAAPGQLDGPVTQNLTLTSCPRNPVTLKMREAKN